MKTTAPTRAPRARGLRRAGLASLAVSAAILSPLGLPTTAQADPAPDAENTVLPVGDFSVTPAAGSCSAIVTIEGGNGGTAVATGPNDDDPDPDDPDQVGGGQGGRIRFRVPLSPTDVLTGVVGRGGSNSGIGGTSGSDAQTADHGGDGGVGGHRGGGGGGYTSFKLNGKLIALAGGGGGSGGGHNPEAGGGGHAGVVDSPGVHAGQEGAAGTDIDSVATPVPDSSPVTYTFTGGPGPGGAGGTNAAGTAGVHSNLPDLNGFAGSGRNGGNGGTDGSLDQGGGGGAGYFGGGGGASTDGNVSGGNPVRLIIGGGGGGGSSFFDDVDGATLIAPAPDSGEGLAPNGGQRNGTAEIEWVPCNYDLSVTKTASAKQFEAGVPVTFTVTVKNNGPERMGIGDTVSITDDKAAGATLVRVVSSSKTDAPITCDVAAGGVMTTGKLECSRPVGSAVRGLNVGETLVLTYRQTYADALPVVNTVSVTDRGNQANNTASASLEVAKPGLKLVKKANRTKVTRVGERITYTFRVRNTGNVVLHHVRIAEGAFSGKGTLAPKCDKLPGKELAPGKVLVCKAIYRTTKGDLKRGSIVNTATASAITPGSQPLVSAPATAVVKTKLKKAPLPGAPNTGARAS